MADYQLEIVTKNVYALAVWDSSWNSYNNCYILTDNGEVTLIDSGKAEHSPILLEALGQLQKNSDAVVTLVATHGHRDHVGGSVILKRAKKTIQLADFPLLPPDLEKQFSPDLPSRGVVQNLECVLLGQHTTGSVALFHPGAKVLFCGDHICFFGSPLSNEGFVSRGSDVRDGFRRLVADWARHWPPSPEDRKRIEEDLATRAPQDRERYNFALFLQGVRSLQEFDAIALCTGHGSVLYGDIPEFLSKLALAQDARP